MTDDVAHNRQPWLRSAGFDTVFILLPPVLALAVCILLPAQYLHSDAMPLAAWVLLVLLIDVAHVYSTLFRTYFNKARMHRHRTLYLAVPLGCFIVGALLYSVGAWLFWRVIAYLAVFHFIRQQYGFLKLYTRKDNRPRWKAYADTAMIYSATLYPIVYWHCSPGRNFDWFVQGDFLIADLTGLKQAAGMLYVLVVSVWLVSEAALIFRIGKANLPKIFLITGTALSWYFGIVYFNGDMAFTLLNVVAHGIPYMALIWIRDVDKPRTDTPVRKRRRIAFQVVFFLITIAGLAYLEEGLWDGLVWRERESVFSLFSVLPVVTSHDVLAILVPLLSLPQTTHYVLDGFIWKRSHL